MSETSIDNQLAQAQVQAQRLDEQIAQKQAELQALREQKQALRDSVADMRRYIAYKQANP